MIQLDLDEPGLQTLREVLESARSELGYEIANTDGHDYREGLKQRQRLVADVIAQIDASLG